MGHRLRKNVFKLLEKFPDHIGDKFYHSFQNVKNRKKELKGLLKVQKKTIRGMKRVFKKLNFDLNQKSVLELGSGWGPFIPYLLLAEFDPQKIFTVDINGHYQSDYIKELNEFFIEEYNFSEDLFSTKSQLPIPEVLEYLPFFNLADHGLGKKIDFMFSRFVLEHIPPQYLLAIHQNIHKDMQDDGLILHFVSPSDHRAFSDKSLSLYDFLKYSKSTWSKIQTRFDYHNRLRLPHYRKIFKKAGFKIVHEHYDLPSDTLELEKFEQLRIHRDFQHYTTEELTAGSLQFALRKI